MTDAQEPAKRTPDLGLPTAGRKPDERTAAEDEPTVVVPPAVDDEPTTLLTPPEPPPVDEEPTTPLTLEPPAEPQPPAESQPSAEPEPALVAAEPAPEPESGPESGPVAVDDEPTVESLTPPPPPPAISGGETVRLKPPAVVPGPADPPAVSPEPVTVAKSAQETAAQETAAEETAAEETAEPKARPRPPWRRWSSAGALIWVLLALFGFTLVVQLRSNSADDGLATARQEDLVRILSDLEARDQRLQSEITSLEQSQRQLTSGVEGRQAALADAQKRADELGLLAGTLAGKGPGLRVVIDPKGLVKASAILNAVQELRGAGGEVMQINGAGGPAVRIVASTYFVDAGSGAITVDGKRLAGPYTIWVIGVPPTMQTALQIPGGVVASVVGAGGSVTMDVRDPVEVSALHEAPSLQYARPVS